MGDILTFFISQRDTSTITSPLPAHAQGQGPETAIAQHSSLSRNMVAQKEKEKQKEGGPHDARSTLTIKVSPLATARPHASLRAVTDLHHSD